MQHFNEQEEYNSFLFSVDRNIEAQMSEGGAIPTELRQEFNQRGFRLTQSTAIEKEGNRWLLRDGKSRREYVVAKKGDRLSIYGNLHVVNQVVERDLCVRCGACEPACPVDIIRFDHQAYPYITDEAKCITTCTRCLKVCPGEVVNLARLDQEMYAAEPHPDSVTGIARRALVSFATDDKLRFEGTSGGFVTQILLYMLDKRLIDGALVLGSSDNEGWQEKPFIARTRDELKRAVKSKYIATPFLRPLREMEEIEGNYAVVALPCYIHGLRKYQRVSKALRERIKLVIGLYCNVVFEPYLFDDVCEFSGFRKEDVVDFHFRHGEWPGGVYATMRNGDKRKILKLEEMKDEFNTLKLLYAAPRCNMCVDFSAEYADIAVGDPWLRGPDGKYLFEDGRTTVLTRTDSGDSIVQRAAAEHYINVEELSLKTYMVNFERSGRYKRDFVPKNIMLRQLLRLPVPQYFRPIGHGKIRGFLPLFIKLAILEMARFRWFRKVGVSIAQRKPVIAWLARNRMRKQKKFALAYPKLEKWVERFSSR